jgi:hypothetical protein
MSPPGQAFPPEVSDADLTMEIVADRQVMYLRAPMYEALAELPGATGQLGPMGDLAALGDRPPCGARRSLTGPGPRT